LILHADSASPHFAKPIIEFCPKLDLGIAAVHIGYLVKGQSLTKVMKTASKSMSAVALFSLVWPTGKWKRICPAVSQLVDAAHDMAVRLSLARHSGGGVLGKYAED
jgi:ABC-type uncharacterized transport system YnjBCD permease subunit